jgi:RNA polymerase sigma-70 factor (ECF subfamily)
MRDELPDVPVPDRAEQRTVERDALERGLAALPAGQRTALVLKDIYGLSCREIGQELGIEEGAVKVRLHRARKGLRERLSEEGFDREA